ncbi:hypothetical protein K4K49_005931 [Colletotrichum sp. SAR 10_70]|nr:hypothetical protein K4K50_008600 [Colletotrichum sp. SAR 10_71]KAI8196993.1 hypothetical protein K4K49_005931 [Colletotrichum sp. SAR 10_70]
MSDDFIDTRIPRNIDDKELSFKAPVPSPVNYPTTYSAVICQAQLAKIADAVYHEFLLAKTASTKVEYRVAETMERDLNRWRQNLPGYFLTTDCPNWFRAPRSVVLWKEQNLRILLWRGSQKYHSYLPTKTNAEEKCLEVAMQSIHDIATFCMANEACLHQGLICRPEEDRLAWQHSVSKARACLKTLEQRSRSAKRCLEMLDRIHSQFQFLPQLDLELDPASFQVSNLAQDITTAYPESSIMPPAHDFMDLPSENDFAFYGESQPVFGDETADPSLRMLLNEASLDFMDNMPLDLLLGDWTT